MIVAGHFLLDLHGTAHRSVHAVEYNELGITSHIDGPATMLVDGWVDQCAAQTPEPLKCPDVIQPNLAAVPNHVGVDDGNQLPAS
jgi:hypothetical protein